MEEEGLVSSSEWIKKVRNVIEKYGFSFEVEEAVRVHIDDLVIQVGESPEGGFAITLSIQLPSAEAIGDVDRYAEVFRKALLLASKLSGELKYELDTSLPDYPFLYISRRYDDVDKLVEDLDNALKSLKS